MIKVIYGLYLDSALRRFGPRHVARGIGWPVAAGVLDSCRTISMVHCERGWQSKPPSVDLDLAVSGHVGRTSMMEKASQGISGPR